MECSRRGEGNDYLSSPLPPVHEVEQHLTAEPLVPGVSGGELPDLEELDTPMIPGYLTLEWDVSDVPGCDPEADSALHQTDWGMSGGQDPEASSLESLDLFTPEEPMIPGYLTLESDLTALSEDSPGELPNNAASDEHCEKP